jgi:hypothetical protein
MLSHDSHRKLGDQELRYSYCVINFCVETLPRLRHDNMDSAAAF